MRILCFIAPLSLISALPVVLWSQVGSPWEWDYVRELFTNKYFRHFSLTSFKTNNNSHLIPSAIVYNVVLAGQNEKYDEIVDMIHNYKVKILIHLSDEYMNSNGYSKYSNGVIPYKHVELVLRQYSPFFYNNISDNVMHIPLGYMKKYMFSHVLNTSLSSTDVIVYSNKKLASQRTYNWSFIGHIGHKLRGRQHAIDVFSTWTPFRISKHGEYIHPPEMRDIYNSSKFVLVGKGDHSYDCFRIYEAIIAGAIPIVSGPEKELQMTFWYNNDKPPLVFAENVTQALQISREMSEGEVDSRRHLLTQWYLRQMHQIRSKIKSILKSQGTSVDLPDILII